ncbi:MAG: MlaD family protein [Verrucomicrobiota bacterium]|jgi:ABC-type transporter Mla subunit MlaD
MPLQDLTPQIRTRLNRAERFVGLFVGLALMGLIGAFGYFIFHTAKQKGWFLTQARYFTYLQSANGISLGDKVKLMGFEVGEITSIEAMPASDWLYNVYVEFVVRSPYHGYLWKDSTVKFVSGDFLGNRYLEVTKGYDGEVLYKEENGKIVEWWDGTEYLPFEKTTKPVWIRAIESNGLNNQIEDILKVVQEQLPNVFALTNQLSMTLDHANQMSTNVNNLLIETQAASKNLVTITENLKDPNGSLGRWLLPEDLNQDIHHTLLSVTNTLSSADTNMTLAVSSLNISLNQLATLTSNFNAQVQANTNILGEISSLVVTANDFMESLRDHWLLRSAFKEDKKKK